MDSGKLSCKDDAATFTDPGGTVWALNGIALGQGIRELDDSIWLDNEAMLAQQREAFPDEDPGTLKLSISPLTMRTLELCE